MITLFCDGHVVYRYKLVSTGLRPRGITPTAHGIVTTRDCVHVPEGRGRNPVWACETGTPCLSFSPTPVSLSISLCGFPSFSHSCFSSYLSLFLSFSQSLSLSLSLSVWMFLLPADHRIVGLMCHCLVAWSPWFYIFII